MITRITRGVLDRNNEAQVFEFLRTSAAARPPVPGLLAFSLNRTMQDRSVVLVSVSLWTDIDAMAASLGPKWHEPSWPGLNEYLTEASVEILETIATSMTDLEELAAAP
jgi:hypothetical protein